VERYDLLDGLDLDHDQSSDEHVKTKRRIHSKRAIDNWRRDLARTFKTARFQFESEATLVDRFE
jgi:hypothetical protein